ncbi:MAG: hypothetical protein ACTH82_08780 [Glutamicibacter ardleyensis]
MTTVNKVRTRTMTIAMKTVWQSYDVSNRERYIKSIQALGVLSPLFRQKSDGSVDQTAFISSKFQETAFAKFFEGNVVDRGNDPYDVMVPSPTLGKRDLVGIKTFLNSSASMQKIMQFKSVATKEEWSSWIKDRDYQQLISRIASIRNQKLRSAQNLLAGAGHTPETAFENIYYHYLSPSKSGTVYIGESDYSFMDEDNLSFVMPGEGKNIASLYFADGRHEYKYTPADSTLYMRFFHTKTIQEGGEIVGNFAVTHSDDPHLSLMRLLVDDALVEVSKQQVALTKGRSLVNAPEITRSSKARKKLGSAGAGLSSLVGAPTVAPDVQFVGAVQPLVPFAESAAGDQRLNTVEAETTFVFPIFRLSQYGDIPAGDVDPKSGLNVRLSKPKNKGSDVARPVNEVEIKIPNATRFHENYPHFFGTNEEGTGISKMHRVDGKWKSIFASNDERTFDLVLTQSGVEMEAIITGDGNKQIMSKRKQQTLGGWILSQVFQLGPYERLDRRKLDELDLDCIRLTRLHDRRIGMEFIKATEDDLKFLWPKNQDKFRQLSTVSTWDEE